MIDIGAHTIKRWINLEEQVRQLVTKFSPELLIIEENFVYKNIKTTAALNQLRGAVLLLAALHKIKVEYVDNQKAKKKILGNTKYWDQTENKYLSVTKDMMLTAIQEAICSCSKKPQSHDAADAVALALTYYDAPVPLVSLPRRPPKDTKKS